MRHLLGPLRTNAFSKKDVRNQEKPRQIKGLLLLSVSLVIMALCIQFSVSVQQFHFLMITLEICELQIGYGM